MSRPNDSRGGAIAIRGLLVQTIVALLDITKSDPPFTEITLEPMVGDDQFDFLWHDAHGSHATQVKSTENSFTKADVERWAGKLQQARTEEHCRLVLVGNIPPSLAKLTSVGAVAIETKNLNLDDLVEQAAHRVAAFLENENLVAGTAKEREMVVHALESKLQHHSTSAKPISRDDFVKLLRQWIGSATKPGAKIDISRIIKYAPDKLIGREAETALLNDAWAKVQSQAAKRPHILTFVALGGEGKTSLVAKWAADLAHQDWPGCEAVFAWSFYSQGTRDQMAASSDLFLKEALNFFGNDDDKQFAASNAGAFEKGQRLARIVGQRRALLILDGLEPLQYAPTSPTPGELKDHGIAALLKGLASGSHGLCLVTTRYALPDLRVFIGNTVHEEKLTRLSTDAGVVLLQSLGVKGSLRKTIPSADGRALWNEYEKLVEDVKGHALTLNLLGTYLRDAHAGDIRRRALINFPEADAEEQGGHAFHVMDAYVKSLESGGKTADDQAKGRRALALLQLLGLFDRPATADCLRALWQPPAITGLTEPLFTVEKKWLGLSQTFQPISEAQCNLSLKRLEDAKLLTVNRAEGSGALIALDTHPLLREYFARRVRRQQPEAWRGAHRRLYEHLVNSAEPQPDDLKGLEPLFRAVSHGCQADLTKNAYSQVYLRRIIRQFEGPEGFFSTQKLGGYSSELGVLACFFEQPWRFPLQVFQGYERDWLQSMVGVCLRAVGRLTEAEEPMQISLATRIARQDWKESSKGAHNLSELELALGKIESAVKHGRESMEFAERWGDAFWQLATRALLGGLLHCEGHRTEALTLFENAEALQTADESKCSVLYGLPGFRYCDLLLDDAERQVWQSTALQLPSIRAISPIELVCHCCEVERRAGLARTWVKDVLGLLVTGLDHLSLGRAALFRGALSADQGEVAEARNTAHRGIGIAVDTLHRCGEIDRFVPSLLSRALLRFIDGDAVGARADLDEAWDIAERGPMRLHQADIHLHRARLFFREKTYPWKSPQDDLAAAEKLINDCGYHRRDEELADAKKAILGQD